MKGENRLKILEFLGDSSRLISDTLFIFTLPYGTSLGKMEHLLRKKHREENLKNIYKEKRRFSDLLYRLKKDNLVEGADKNGRFFLKLTLKGKKCLEKMRFAKPNVLPNNQFQSESENLFKIVIFDIPEKERRKRAWLRAALRNLKFIMLQKSVWIGKAKLPREFISAIDDLNLSSYVEIFVISKSGSLRQLDI